MENVWWSGMSLAEPSLAGRAARALFPQMPALDLCLFDTLTVTPCPTGAVTPVKMCERHIAVEAGPSRTQILLSSAGERASARRCRSRRMKAARCMASWRSIRYQEGSRQDRAGWASSAGNQGPTQALSRQKEDIARE